MLDEGIEEFQSLGNDRSEIIEPADLSKLLDMLQSLTLAVQTLKQQVHKQSDTDLLQHSDRSSH